MKPAAFDYACPENVGEALTLLAERGAAARICAGGQSLGSMMNLRLVTPEVLIDIAGLSELKSIALVGGAIEVGAAVTQAEFLAWPDLASFQPLLAKMLPWIGHYQTRQRGTVCGSLAHGDPSSELPLALALLRGEVLLASRRGRRVVSAEDFQLGMMATDIREDEMIVAARLPVAQVGAASAFHEVAQRHGDFAIVAVAAFGDDKGVRIGVGGVADTPGVIDLKWPVDDTALNDFAWSLGGTDDQHATARYRRELVRRLGRRAIDEVRDAIS
ncbi:MAG: carbon monoxide dehydrogenase [Rhodospirillaceae bacterium]|jgi:2-furoyl-CoA dehydrogenase FAD binding subunit|nr:carbon monoxide dehydrogenase [Rhodospirillaceae bacterium]MBT4489702.1 carbon monoxide dehydrogenase [Rhodospirillaceae bacterium]MBT5195041.1 carbon monoxide dehydrogenase [Rhodospirillaceae bacterium]MBT5895679.1 carbon monoxide dehydrogenase [Rhodospirillaceae bacterium]MBT6428966.1 carbon monoxide dehydrogenase [Rhodospirillaceae bacterium]